jgi:hypothetical protein
VKKKELKKILIKAENVVNPARWQMDKFSNKKQDNFKLIDL